MLMADRAGGSRRKPVSDAVCQVSDGEIDAKDRCAGEHFDRRDVVKLQVGIGCNVVEAKIAKMLPDRRLGMAREARAGDARMNSLLRPAPR